MKRLLLDEELEELIRRLAPDLKKKIRGALDEIASHPQRGKSLVEDLEGCRSYRVGRMRIIYRPETEWVEIMGIGPRETIYEQIALEIRKRTR